MTKTEFNKRILSTPSLTGRILLGELGRYSLAEEAATAFDMEVSERWARDAIDYVKENAGDNAMYAAFKAFVTTKGRTLDEIRDKFGDHSADYLERSVPGHHLFETRDKYGTPHYILLPNPPERFKLESKLYSWYQPEPHNGLVQPYILIDIPKSFDDVDLHIAPLFDIHFGHKAHRIEKLLKWIEWVRTTPNVYVILGGDLVENALDDGRGMSYDQILPPMNQLNSISTLLAPIAHKILVSVPGNHEDRTYKKTGLDFAEVLANELEIPYVAGPTFLSLGCNGHAWNFHVFHGRGNSQTKGGKMNAASRPKKFTSDIQFFLSGHVHDADVIRETCVAPDPVNGRLMMYDQFVVICQSFLGWEDTYAWKAGYAPPSLGGVGIKLNTEDGSYGANLV